MHGNVWEWTNTADGFCRVYRGGGFDFPAERCSAGYQLWDNPVYSDWKLGFRLAASGRAD